MSKERQISVRRATKSVVTVAEMSRMVGLSRARFYQLIDAGVFLKPVYSVLTKRPIYVEEQQEICLTVKQRNCGINGKPVLFYSKRAAPRLQTTTATKQKVVKAKADNNLVASIKALGLLFATAADVQRTVEELYPQGVDYIDQGEVIRAVFLKLKHQNSADKAG